MSSAEILVFLDFDGVLHPGNVSRDEFFICLPRFEKVIREFDNARIVISSSWRCFYTLAQLATHFSIDIRSRIIGATPVIQPDMEHNRLNEIELYLAGRSKPHGPWIAIDDNSREFSQGCENVLLCNPKQGFDNATAAKLRSWLAAATS